MNLQWRTCAHDTWCAFESVVLPDANASGIIVIWSGLPEHIMYVGQGGIAKNLKWARQFRPIATQSDLFVTWATLPEDRQSGVRNYLSTRLKPVYSDPPDAEPAIPVNLPWETA
jgi:hypothetical protein